MSFEYLYQRDLKSQREIARRRGEAEVHNIFGPRRHEPPRTETGPKIIHKRFQYVDSKHGPACGDYGKKSELNQYFVSAIVSPDEFYMQNPKYQNELDLLEANMTDWYGKYWDYDPTALMTKETVKFGEFYAVYDSGSAKCYRARIDGLILNSPETEYHGQYIDHGIHGFFHLDEIYSLRLDYLKLPTQACVARLYDSTEPRQDWTQAATKQFEADFFKKNATGYIMRSNENTKQCFTALDVILVKDEADGRQEIYTLGGLIKLPM